jgi:hypothetical protein
MWLWLLVFGLCGGRGPSGRLMCVGKTGLVVQVEVTLKTSQEGG